MTARAGALALILAGVGLSQWGALRRLFGAGRGENSDKSPFRAKIGG